MCANAKASRNLTALLVMAVLCGQSYGRQPDEPARQLPDSSVRPDNLLWSSAQECFKKAQYKESREKFIQFARQFRNDRQYKEALFYQGLCEIKLGKDSQAQNTWDRVLQQEMPEKNKSKAWLLIMEQRALWYGQKGKEEDRKKALKQLLAEFPTNPLTVRLHIQAAEEKLKASDYAGALSFYRAVEDQLTDQDKKNLELAVAMTMKGGGARELLTAANESLEKDHVDQAIKLYQTVLKENPASPQAAEAKTKLGWCFYLQQKYAEAEPLWWEVVKKGPVKDKWVGESRWHIIQMLTGPRDKPDKAIELCDVQAGEFAGAFRGQQAVFIKAWIYWTMKDWAKAHRSFMDLVSAYPETAQHKPIQDYIRDCEQGIRDTRRGGK